MFAQASFLNSGRAYSFDVPGSVRPTPELHGIITSNAARYMTFRPTGTETDPRDNQQLEHVFDVVSHGQNVEIFRALDEPSTRVAYWRLPVGLLQTFTDDRFSCGDDTDATIKAIVADIVVRVNRIGLPVVQLNGRLRAGNPRNPVERESIMFHPADDKAGAPLVSVWSEPSWSVVGGSRWDNDGWSARSATNELNLTVEVQGPRDRADDLERQARHMAASATPVG